MSPLSPLAVSVAPMALELAGPIIIRQGKQNLPPGPRTLGDLDQLQGSLGAALQPFLTRPLTAELLTAIQDYLLAAGPLIQRSIISSTLAARSTLDLETLATAIRRIDPEAAREVFVPFLNRFRDSLLSSPGLRKPLSFSQEVGGVVGAFEVSAIIGEVIDFDPLYPEVVEAVNYQAATLVRQVTDETRMAIRDVINRAFTEGMDPRRAAKPIIQILKTDELVSVVADTAGLTRYQARAVGRYMARLLDDGMESGRAVQLTKKYAQKMLKLRAETIARTEMVRAQNLGQQASWDQMISQGTLNPNAVQKVWQTAADDRTCPICQPMDGKLVAVQGDFNVAIRYSMNGPVARSVTYQTPPAHPNCRCRVYLQPVPAFFQAHGGALP